MKERPTPVKPVNTDFLSRLEDYFGYRTLGDPELVRMLMAVYEFCQAMRDGKDARGLSLLGTTGTGKSHLAKRVAKYWADIASWQKIPAKEGFVEFSRPGRFFSWRTICKKLSNGAFDIIDAVVELDFAVLDDIGTEHDPNGFKRKVLDQILDAREGKWTVITSNLTLEQIAQQIDVRVSSRMLRHNGVVIEVDTMDYQLRTRQ